MSTGVYVQKLHRWVVAGEAQPKSELRSGTLGE